jgi:hypothetical protein
MIWIKSKAFLLSTALMVSLLGSAVYYIYNQGQQSIYKEVTIERQENYIETRRRIDEATRTTNSLDAARQRLLERQLRRQKGE